MPFFLTDVDQSFNMKLPGLAELRNYRNQIGTANFLRRNPQLQPMLGFQRFYNARRIIAGIELAQKIHKGQFKIPAAFGSNAASIWGRVLAA